MIVFGVCAGPGLKFDEIAGPSIERVGERDSVVIVLRDQSSLCRAYNMILERVRHMDGVEAVVLIHDDVELDDSDACAIVRRLSAQSDIAIGGVVGARGVNKLSWWHGAKLFGEVVEEHESRVRTIVGKPVEGLVDVDAVDGVLLVLTPLAIETLQFDEDFPGFDGYDGALCAAARAAGHRVVVTDIAIRHHTSGERTDHTRFHRADLIWQLKWRPMPAWKWILWKIRLPITPVELRVRHILATRGIWPRWEATEAEL